MRYEVDLRKVRVQLDQAMGTVPNDRWLLAGLRNGSLKVLADSNPDASPSRRGHEMAALCRRALSDGKPLAVTSLIDVAGDRGQPEDWEADWRSLVYVPIVPPRSRPAGIFILGCRGDYWYDDDDIAYVAAIGQTMLPLIQMYCGPLGRLTVGQRRAALLLANGLSSAEIASALRVTPEQARHLAAEICRRLKLRSPRQLAALLPELPPTPGGSIPITRPVAMVAGEASGYVTPGASGPNRNTVVPRPGVLTTSSRPPIPAARSRIPTRP